MNRNHPFQLDASSRTGFEQPSGSSFAASPPGSDAYCSSEPEDNSEDDDDDMDILLKAEDDEDALLMGINESNTSESPQDEAKGNILTLSETKKKRGRPRKSPSSPFKSQTKVAKGRTKTGCITCRRRKKKCDEAKPSCLNCQKNVVICEGYAPRELWRSGGQRFGESYFGNGRKISIIVPRGLPVLIDGIETAIDRQFLDHFVYDLSNVLTLHDNRSNPFKDLLLPMAIQHKGLMHSLMAFSGSHIISRQPKSDFDDRQFYHFSIAISSLNADIIAAKGNESGNEPESLLVEDFTVASTIVHCLICISMGTTNGEYRMHMNGARELISKRKSSNAEFQRFILEFFLYHEIASTLTTIDLRPSMKADDSDGSLLPNFLIDSTIQPSKDAMIGVSDGLFKFISRVTALRDIVRARKNAGREPIVPYESLAQAFIIDADIRAWDAAHDPGSSRWVAAQLYRQCSWVYLYRSIHASKPSPKIIAAVHDGLQYLRMVHPQESTQAILLLPVFILSCAAFQEDQRHLLETAFDNLQAYSNLGNISVARKIVKRVWKMMDAGDERSWDWEGIMAAMGLDLLLT